ncbi:substrate-binding periplasmic protein [Roseateles saccharophilus]|uniref:Extracellular solute-binding protein (Family 3) n=1 Tax=Roseateles saccharophilus TaxID=304 RepID=A0A4V2VSW0_ROSSA|nr:transporter substrate-binding domain-containing protein [Roseateles saccharophilus]MDG0832459.1 transporter substrate-binding domain-containing protein [Roseateles saccharophilus]TCV03920.1 extracellular solute-binding protein (family 3) [Roseateles saccharophilus]
MRKLPAWPVLLAALLATAGPALADHFVIGVEDVDAAPIMSTGPDGELRGYVRDLLDRFASRHGHSFEYRPLPTRRLTAEHVAGRLDAVFPDNPNWKTTAKQGAHLVYSEPAVPFQDVVMVPAARRDQMPHELGIVRGYTPKRFQPLIEAGRLHVTEAGSPRRLIRMALAGRVDGVQVALPVARYQLMQLGQPGALVPGTALPAAPYEYHYRLSSARHAELVAQFDRFLHEEPAALAALQHRHGLDERFAADLSPTPR